MGIATLLTNVARLLPADRIVRQDAMLSPEQLQKAAICERMRVDRNGSVLSVLTIALPTKMASPADRRRFATSINKRLRLTDSAGMMPDGRFGILLPDTPESGAWKVAADLCEPFVPGNSRPRCEVMVYPESQQKLADFPLPEDSGVMPATEELPGGDQLFTMKPSRWKRLLDVVGATIGLIVAGPLILAAAAAVKLTSPGSAFFIQEREGLGGKRFRIAKLRTMRSDAELLKDDLRKLSEQDGPAFKMSDDPRVTRVGRWLRKTSIDELPQLWNVLRGDMSLVGPRPLPTSESLQCCPWQRQRLLVMPGLTCIWQIYGRNVVSFEDWIRMDLRYIRRRSLWYDLQLIAATVPAIVFSKGPR